MPKSRHFFFEIVIFKISLILFLKKLRFELMGRFELPQMIWAQSDTNKQTDRQAKTYIFIQTIPKSN